MLEKILQVINDKENDYESIAGPPEEERPLSNEEILEKGFNLFRYIRDDFFGHLKGKPLELKKIRILSIYRYLYRFALEKIQSFSNSPSLMLLTLQYLKESKMVRIH